MLRATCGSGATGSSTLHKRYYCCFFFLQPRLSNLITSWPKTWDHSKSGELHLQRLMCGLPSRKSHFCCILVLTQKEVSKPNFESAKDTSTVNRGVTAKKDNIFFFSKNVVCKNLKTVNLLYAEVKSVGVLIYNKSWFVGRLRTTASPK